MVLQQAITVAVRYAAVRRQFPTKRGQPDNQILNYATHEYRLMPLLAAAYAVHFTSERLDEKFNHAVDQMKQNEFGPVKELHPTSAGLKAFCTWMTHYALDEMRQSMGGHGYSKYAGLSDSFNDFAGSCVFLDSCPGLLVADVLHFLFSNVHLGGRQHSISAANSPLHDKGSSESET
jgi:acyl-CoA oxidase